MAFPLGYRSAFWELFYDVRDKESNLACLLDRALSLFDWRCLSGVWGLSDKFFFPCIDSSFLARLVNSPFASQGYRAFYLFY